MRNQDQWRWSSNGEGSAKEDKECFFAFWKFSRSLYPISNFLPIPHSFTDAWLLLDVCQLSKEHFTKLLDSSYEAYLRKRIEFGTIFLPVTAKNLWQDAALFFLWPLSWHELFFTIRGFLLFWWLNWKSHKPPVAFQFNFHNCETTLLAIKIVV